VSVSIPTSQPFTDNWLAATDLVRVGYWSGNREAPPAWTPGRIQSWPTMTFCHAGAFKVGSSRHTEVVDRAACMIVAEDREYATLRLVHGSGSDVAVRPDVFAELIGSPRKSGAGAALGVDRLSRVLPTAAVFEEARLSASVEQSKGDLQLEERVLRLLAAILGTRASPATVKPNGRVDIARAYLSEYFSERLSLRQVASVAHTSPYHLCRLFRKATGMSLHRYQIRLRLFAAVRELVDPECSLADLAHRLGFCHQSHLGQAFRREFGIPPHEARRSLACSSRCIAQSLAEGGVTH
jgi:AraC-like DNA-binding protein